jgi:hypothetical protein
MSFVQPPLRLVEKFALEQGHGRSFYKKDRRNDKEEQLPVNTKVFANEEEFQGAFLSRSPFPMTKTKNGQLFALYYGGDRKSLKHVMQRRIQRSNIEGSANQHHGLFYWRFWLTGKLFVFNMKETSNFGVLLGLHGSSEQGVYTVVWKNWSTDMFGEYNFKQMPQSEEEGATISSSAQEIHQPFMYNEEYYNLPPIDFKCELGNEVFEGDL